MRKCYSAHLGSVRVLAHILLPIYHFEIWAAMVLVVRLALAIGLVAIHYYVSGAPGQQTEATLTLELQILDPQWVPSTNFTPQLTSCGKAIPTIQVTVCDASDITIHILSIIRKSFDE